MDQCPRGLVHLRVRGTDVKPAHYRGTYHRRAMKVREMAYADPRTRCWRCGRMLHEHGPRAKWTAGHVRDGDPTSPLLPEGSSCNYRAGQALAQARMRKQTRSALWN